MTRTADTTPGECGVAAPELITERWFNAKAPVTLSGLRGRPVLLHTFQMLCPGCVMHAIPQAQRIAAMLRDSDLAVIGLHTVFEHHAAMTPVSLEAFLHEYRITFPVGVDKPGEHGPIPQTMAAYGFRGTPSTVLIDHQGLIRHQGFGQEDDIAIGLRIGMLLAEDRAVAKSRSSVGGSEGRGCEPGGVSGS
jgi:peroxiredoxin